MKSNFFSFKLLFPDLYLFLFWIIILMYQLHYCYKTSL